MSLNKRKARLVKLVLEKKGEYKEKEMVFRDLRHVSDYNWIENKHLRDVFLIKLHQQLLNILTG